MARPPENEDLKNIVLVWYPKLEPLVGRLIGICRHYYPPLASQIPSFI